jgi:hypothetical protein
MTSIVSLFYFNFEIMIFLHFDSGTDEDTKHPSGAGCKAEINARFCFTLNKICSNCDFAMID